MPASSRLPLICIALALVPEATPAQPPAPVAIVGATVIDGNGGAPLQNATVLIEGARIRSLGPRAATSVPGNARVIDGAGRFLIPGLIDTNVHLSLYGGINERYETLVRYHARQEEIVLEAAQLALRSA